MNADALHQRISRLQDEMARLYAQGDTQRALCVSQELDELIVRAMRSRMAQEAELMGQSAM